LRTLEIGVAFRSIQWKVRSHSLLGVSCFFFGNFEITEKILSHFGRNVWKCRLLNTVTASCNTTETNDQNGSVTKMSQRKNRAKHWELVLSLGQRSVAFCRVHYCAKLRSTHSYPPVFLQDIRRDWLFFMKNFDQIATKRIAAAFNVFPSIQYFLLKNCNYVTACLLRMFITLRRSVICLSPLQTTKMPAHCSVRRN